MSVWFGDHLAIQVTKPLVKLELNGVGRATLELNTGMIRTLNSTIKLTTISEDGSVDQRQTQTMTLLL